jgi:hypothetical protein
VKQVVHLQQFRIALPAGKFSDPLLYAKEAIIIETKGRKAVVALPR